MDTEASSPEEINFLRPLETFHYPTRGYCMYCGSRRHRLTDEHIIPYFLMGGHIADQASCDECSEVTKKFEEYLAQNTYFFIRNRLNFQSRSRKKNKQKAIDLFVTIQKNGKSEKIRVRLDQYPPVVGHIVVDLPGIIRGAPFVGHQQMIRSQFSNLGHVMPGEYVYGTVRQKSDLTSELRLAAKIAHGFFFVSPYYGQFEPLLTDVILTGYYASYFVGGIQSIEDNHRENHEKINASYVQFEVGEIRSDPNYIYLIARVDLLISYGGPSYLAVVGRKKKEHLFVYQNHSDYSLPIPPKVPRGAEVKLDEHALHTTVFPSKDVVDEVVAKPSPDCSPQ